jgi:WD40 repeat protein
MARGGDDRQPRPLSPKVLTRIGTARFCHPFMAYYVQFLPDTRRFVSAGCDQTVRVWDLKTGRELWKQRFEGFPRRFALSSDGKIVASVGPRSIVLRDTNSGKVLHQMIPKGAMRECLAFSPDGKVLAVGGWDEAIAFWEVATGKLLRTLQGRKKRCIDVLVFRPDGKSLVGRGQGPGGTELSSWDVATGKRKLLSQRQRDDFGVLCFSPDGKLLAVARGQQLGMRDMVAGTERFVLGLHVRDVTTAGFTPDGKTLISGAGDGTIHFWDVKTGREVRHLRKDIFSIAAVSLSPDGKVLASAGSPDGSIRLWDPATGKALGKDDTPPAAGELIFSADGQTLVSSGHIDWAVRFWDPVTGKEKRRLKGGGRVAFAPDEKTLAFWGTDNTIRVCEAVTGKERWVARLHRRPELVAFSADGDTLVSADARHRTLGLWEPQSGKHRRSFEIPGTRLYDVAFSPHTMTFATYNNDLIQPKQPVSVLRLWNALTGKRFLTAPDDWPTAHWMTFSSDGWLLAACVRPHPGAWDTLFHDSVTGEMIGGFPGMHGKGVFSPDGRLLATPGVSAGKPDETLQLWDVASSDQVAEWKVGDGGAVSLAFSPDCKRLATSQRAGGIVVWDLSGLPIPAPKARPLTPKRFEEVWQHWGDQGKRLFMLAEVAEVAAAGDTAVALLKNRLRPVPTPDLKSIRKQIALLGSEDDKVRQAALKELERVAASIEPLLNQAEDETASPQVLRGLEQLGKTRWYIKEPDQLRAVRGIQVLERIASPQARALLKGMAKGWSLARQTRYARQALARLERVRQQKKKDR